MRKINKRDLAIIIACVAVSIAAIGYIMSMDLITSRDWMPILGQGMTATTAATPPPVGVPVNVNMAPPADVSPQNESVATDVESPATGIESPATGIESVEISKTDDDAVYVLDGSLDHSTLKIDWDIKAKSTTSSTRFSMANGEDISMNVIYSPMNAEIDIGIIQPDGAFRFVSGTSGQANHTFEISQSGEYAIRIRNHDEHLVTTIGFVDY